METLTFSVFSIQNFRVLYIEIKKKGPLQTDSSTKVFCFPTCIAILTFYFLYLIQYYILNESQSSQIEFKLLIFLGDIAVDDTLSQH